MYASCQRRETLVSSSHLTALRAMRTARLQEGLPPGGLASATTRRQRYGAQGLVLTSHRYPPEAVISTTIGCLSLLTPLPRSGHTDRRPGEMHPLDSRGCGGTLFSEHNRVRMSSSQAGARPLAGLGEACDWRTSSGHDRAPRRFICRRALSRFAVRSAARKAECQAARRSRRCSRGRCALPVAHA